MTLQRISIIVIILPTRNVVETSGTTLSPDLSQISTGMTDNEPVGEKSWSEKEVGSFNIPEYRNLVSSGPSLLNYRLRYFSSLPQKGGGVGIMSYPGPSVHVCVTSRLLPPCTDT